MVHAPARHTVEHVVLSCQLPDRSHSCTVVPAALHCLAPGAHVVHAPLMHAVVQGGPLFWKTPIESHRMGWLLVHFVAPGLQSVQLPEMQAAVQAVPSFHMPVASQVCGIFPLHLIAPGLHTPPQVPPEQMNGQGEPPLALVQCPPESQSCG